jgi:hypothetical protein
MKGSYERSGDYNCQHDCEDKNCCSAVIGVVVDNNVVTLTGHVNSYAEKLAAIAKLPYNGPAVPTAGSISSREELEIFGRCGTLGASCQAEISSLFEQSNTTKSEAVEIRPAA